MKQGFAFRLSVMIVACVTVILAIVLGYNYYFSRQIISGQIEKNAGESLRATLNQLDTIFFSLQKATKALTIPMQDPEIARRKDAILFLIRKVVQENKEVYGSTISFEPYTFDPNRRFFAPYYYKFRGKLKFKYIPYNYFSWSWYMMPQLLNRPAWVEPYYDKSGGNIVMSTYSVPLYRTEEGEKEFVGVATVDVSLAWLQKIVSSIRTGTTGFGFLVSKMGTFVTHPNQSVVMRKTITGLARKRGDKALSEIGLKMIRGETGFVPYNGFFAGKPSWIAYGPLRSNGWSLGIVFPKAELLSDIAKLNRRVMVISLAGFGLLLCAVLLVARGISRPLSALSEVTNRIARGDWDVALPPVCHEDEVGVLTHSFERMKTSLKQYFKDLQDTTAAKERIESELRIAREIQMGLVPKTFPPFPDHDEFDIYAILDPAREVGGDFYDFFFNDDTHLCFVVGDVSGKGVPAALFMAVTKTLIKSDVNRETDPAAIVTRVNRDLAGDNPSLMFVTLFIGILNVRTKDLAYCNGGHNPPYVVEADGGLALLSGDHGMALGVNEAAVYRSQTRRLNAGDSLFVYTDGVTEAMGSKGDFFGEDRLESLLTWHAGADVKELTEAILRGVRGFAGDAPQSDDITLLGLKINGA